MDDPYSKMQKSSLLDRDDMEDLSIESNLLKGEAYLFPQNREFVQSYTSAPTSAQTSSITSLQLSGDNLIKVPVDTLRRDPSSSRLALVVSTMAPLEHTMGTRQAPQAMEAESVEFLNASGM